MGPLPDIIVHVHIFMSKTGFHQTSRWYSIYLNTRVYSEIHHQYTFTRYPPSGTLIKTPTFSLHQFSLLQSRINCKQHFCKWTSYPVTSNHHQQSEDIPKKSLRARFRDRNSNNSDILLERISLTKKGEYLLQLWMLVCILNCWVFTNCFLGLLWLQIIKNVSI